MIDINGDIILSELYINIIIFFIIIAVCIPIIFLLFCLKNKESDKGNKYII